MWNRCNERNVKQVQVYSKKIQKPYDNNTYIQYIYIDIKNIRMRIILLYPIVWG